MLADDTCDTHDNSFTVWTGQSVECTGFGHTKTDNTDQNTCGHSDHYPYRGNTAGKYQFFLILDCHETDKNMRHTKVTESPCSSWENCQKVIFDFRTGGNIKGRCQRQITRKGGCVVHNGCPTTCSWDSIDQNDRKCTGHNDTLNKVCNTYGIEPTGDSVTNNQQGGQHHGNLIIDTE